MQNTNCTSSLLFSPRLYTWTSSGNSCASPEGRFPVSYFSGKWKTVRFPPAHFSKPRRPAPMASVQKRSLKYRLASAPCIPPFSGPSFAGFSSLYASAFPISSQALSASASERHCRSRSRRPVQRILPAGLLPGSHPLAVSPSAGAEERNLLPSQLRLAAQDIGSNSSSSSCSLPMDRRPNATESNSSILSAPEFRRP